MKVEDLVKYIRIESILQVEGKKKLGKNRVKVDCNEKMVSTFESIARLEGVCLTGVCNGV